MRKEIVINYKINRSILQIINVENKKFDNSSSYSRIVNYLVVLGIERYKEFTPGSEDVEIPPFNFSKFNRRLSTKR